MTKELDVYEKINKEAINDEQGNLLIAMSEDEAEFYRQQHSNQAHDL